jgi:hypothetical protein
MKSIEPTKIKIVEKKDSGYNTVIYRIVLKAYENGKTKKDKNLTTAAGYFDVVYKDDTFQKIIINDQKADWKHNDMFHVSNDALYTPNLIKVFEAQNKFWDEFSKAVKNHKKEKVADMVNYPIYVGNKEVKTKKEFIQHYYEFFTLDIQKRIVNGFLYFPIAYDPDEGDVKRGDIYILSPISIFHESGMSMDLLFRKVKGKYKLISKVSFA